MKLFIFLMFFSTALFAETLSWNAPIDRQDGTPMAIEEISHYNLSCTLPDGAMKITKIPATSPDGTHEISKHEVLPGYGEASCTMSTVDVDGMTSPPSNSAALVWNKADPNPPTILLIIS